MGKADADSLGKSETFSAENHSGGGGLLTPSPPEVGTADAFPIVGIGASAGGLEALESFFSNMPAEPGLSFVVIQHLSPETKSFMRELLQAKTKMAVLGIENGIKIEPNRVYVNPPGIEISFSTELFIRRSQERARPLYFQSTLFFALLLKARKKRPFVSSSLGPERTAPWGSEPSKNMAAW